MDDRQLEKLISELQSGNAQQRRAASYKLGKSNNPVVVPALIHAYSDIDGSVRQNVVDGLRKIGSKEAIDFLNLKEIPLSEPIHVIPALTNFRMGATAGSGVIFTAIIILQFAVLGTAWFREFLFLLIIAILSALFLGLPAGAFGGLILGSIWKNRIAAIIGGSIAALILAPVIFWLFSPCIFLGGC